MKIIESWRFAIKCIKLSYNIKVNLFATGFLLLIGLLYEIMDLNSNIKSGMGAIMLVIVAMYPAQMIYSICGSQLAQSSPCKKAMMTSLPTVITFSSGMLAYLLVIVIEVIRAIRNPETAERCAGLILLIGMMLMFLNIYIGIAFKYFVVSMIMMIGIMSGGYYYCYRGIAVGVRTMVLPWLTGISMPIAIAAGLCFAVLGSLLQYGISLLLYKRPISRTAIYGLLRQQT